MRILLLLTLVACAHSSNQSGEHRSRERCEKLLKHSLDVEKDMASIALDDHKYQQRKLERQTAEAYEEIKKDPEFLPRCRAITNAEYDCMMRAKDPYAIEACKSQPVAKQNSEPSDVVAMPDPPAACPAANIATGNASISGTVTAGKQPRAGVLIIVQAPDVDQSVITDEQGGYKLDVPAGQYQLTFIEGDHRVTKTCVVIVAGKTTTIDASLDT